MFRVRRSKLTLLASAVATTLPSWGFAQNSATWTYSGGGANNGPWNATWTDTTGGGAIKPWAPNTTYPNAAAASPLFPGSFTTNGMGTITLGIGVTVNSLNFYGAGTNAMTAPSTVNTDGYLLTGAGSITLAPNSGTNIGTIDVSAIGNDATIPATPITLPGMATLAISMTQSSGSLYKTGVGTLVLNASNNFAGVGGIVVNDGVLRVLQSDALAGIQGIATANTGAIELYNNASSVNSQGTILIAGLGSGTPSANGELAAMGGSNSTWGGPSSILALLSGSPSLGAALNSTLTIGGTILDAGTGGLTKVGAGMVITPGLQLAGPLNINGGTQRIAAVTGNSNANVSYVKGLTIAGGATPTASLDLTNNDMVIDYTGSSTPFATIRAQVISGYNHGSWNGPGIISSKIPTSPNDSSERGLTTALGYAENANLGLSTIDGLNVPSTSIIVKYTFPGDANLDGSVDGLDATIWATHFTGALGAGGTETWQDGDWNYDGSVDGLDATLWATHFTGALGAGGLSPILTSLDVPVPYGTNPQAISILESMGINVTVVPEPTVMSGLVIGLMGLVSRRKRRA